MTTEHELMSFAQGLRDATVDAHRLGRAPREDTIALLVDMASVTMSGSHYREGYMDGLVRAGVEMDAT